MNLTTLTHRLIDEHFNEKKHPIGLAIDATCGNGFDSLFLAQRAKRLLCFDIQTTAIEITRKCLATKSFSCVVDLFQRSHSELVTTLKEKKLTHGIDIVMFNLGFLPQSNNLDITTKEATTVAAIKQSIQYLSNQGIITILCYRGDKNDPNEFIAIHNLIKSLSKTEWLCQQFDSAKATQTTPVLLLIKRK